jgi:Tfp pilus assembly protein PilN
MLRINLLPTYLEEQKKLRLAIVGASLLFAAVTAGMLGYHFLKLKADETAATDRATAAAEARTAAEAINTKADGVLTSIRPILDKTEFVEQVRFQNEIRQRIFANAAKYTDAKVEYDSMSVNGDTFTVNAYCRSIADLGRFYLTMFNNPDFTAVSIQGIPGWPNAASVNSKIGQNPFGAGDAQQQRLSTWFPVQLTAKMVRPVVSPALPTSLSGGAGGAGGFPGGPFGGGGFPGGGRPSFSGPPAGSGAPADPGAGAPPDA